MKKLKSGALTFRQIEVNGHIFDILKSDVDIIEKAAVLRDKYTVLDKSTNDTEITTAIREAIGYIDEMLGEGACAKIRTDKKGRVVPLGIVEGIQLMTDICQAVTEAYNEDMVNKYV